MTYTEMGGENAHKLDTAQRQAIHELRGEPGDHGWRAAGLLAAAHVVPCVGLSPTGGDHHSGQPTGDHTLCFFVDLLELGGSVCVLFPQAQLAEATPGTLLATLKQTAHAMLALQQSREA